MQYADQGRALRDAQLDMFQVRDAEFLASCRALAVAVCQEQGTVSINDIRAQIPLPAEMHPSVLGAVFKTKQFEACGYTEATHPQAHARVIRIYKLKENLNGQQSHA
jgi:hypothetical protein